MRSDEDQFSDDLLKQLSSKDTNSFRRTWSAKTRKRPFLLTHGVTDDHHIAEIFRQKFTSSGTQPLDLYDANNETNRIEMIVKIFSVEEADTAVRCLCVAKAAGIGRLIVEHVMMFCSVIQVL